MVRVVAKKKLGSELSEQAIDRFTEFCERQRYDRGPAAEAALMLLEVVPPDLRNLVMVGDEKGVAQWFARATEQMTGEDVERWLGELLSKLHADERRKAKNGKAGGAPTHRATG